MLSKSGTKFPSSDQGQEEEAHMAYKYTFRRVKEYPPFTVQFAAVYIRVPSMIERRIMVRNEPKRYPS